MVIPQKIDFLFFFVLIIILSIPSDNIAISNSIGTWRPFYLQHSIGSNFLLLYNNEEVGNQDLIVEVFFTNLTHMKLGFISTQIKEDRTFKYEYFEISKTGTTIFTFLSVRVGLVLETRLDTTQRHTVKASGQYRINAGEWNQFELIQYFPRSLTIFEDCEFEYNLRVDLNIAELIGVLEMDYSYSELKDSIEHTEMGEYSSDITAHFVSLFIDPLGKFGRASGLYRVNLYGQSGTIAKKTSFKSAFVMILIIFIYSSKRFFSKTK